MEPKPDESTPDSADVVFSVTGRREFVKRVVPLPKPPEPMVHTASDQKLVLGTKSVPLPDDPTALLHRLIGGMPAGSMLPSEMIRMADTDSNNARVASRRMVELEKRREKRRQLEQGGK